MHKHQRFDTFIKPATNSKTQKASFILYFNYKFFKNNYKSFIPLTIPLYNRYIIYIEENYSHNIFTNNIPTTPETIL